MAPGTAQKMESDPLGVDRGDCFSEAVPVITPIYPKQSLGLFHGGLHQQGAVGSLGDDASTLAAVHPGLGGNPGAPGRLGNGVG